MRTSRWKTAVLMVGAAGASAQTPVKPMAADAHPSFAVATIKPHDPDSNRQGFDAVGDRYTIRNQSIVSLMTFAYSIHKHQIVDAPAWAGTERFDIEGTTDTPGEPNLHQQQEMLQKLLADRFGLRFHRETRELPVYAIEIAKGGPKLKPAANPDAEADQEASGHGTDGDDHQRHDGRLYPGHAVLLRPAAGGPDGNCRPSRLCAAVHLRRGACDRSERSAGTFHRHPGAAGAEAGRC